jgi:hypothetical protein
VWHETLPAKQVEHPAGKHFHGGKNDQLVSQLPFAHSSLVTQSSPQPTCGTHVPSLQYVPVAHA